MRRWLAFFRVFAIGRKAPETPVEWRRRRWGGLEPRFTVTQAANAWKLRIPRRTPLRRRA